MAEDPELVELRRESNELREQIKRQRIEIERIKSVRKAVDEACNKVYNDFQLGLISREDAKAKIAELKEQLSNL
jgi:ribosomal protein L29